MVQDFRSKCPVCAYIHAWRTQYIFALNRKSEAITQTSGNLPAPPLYSEVCSSLDLPSTEVPDPYEIPLPSPPPVPSPPTYTLLPEELPQKLTEQEQEGLCDFQCAACKFKTKFVLPNGKQVGLVRCSKCKECTVSVCQSGNVMCYECLFIFFAAVGTSTKWQSVWTLCIL